MALLSAFIGEHGHRWHLPAHVKSPERLVKTRLRLVARCMRRRRAGETLVAKSPRARIFHTTTASRQQRQRTPRPRLSRECDPGRRRSLSEDQRRLHPLAHVRPWLSTDRLLFDAHEGRPTGGVTGGRSGSGSSVRQRQHLRRVGVRSGARCLKTSADPGQRQGRSASICQIMARVIATAPRRWRVGFPRLEAMTTPACLQTRARPAQRQGSRGHRSTAGREKSVLRSEPHLLSRRAQPPGPAWRGVSARSRLAGHADARAASVSADGVFLWVQGACRSSTT